MKALSPVCLRTNEERPVAGPKSGAQHRGDHSAGNAFRRVPVLHHHINIQPGWITPDEVAPVSVVTILEDEFGVADRRDHVLLAARQLGVVLDDLPAPVIPAASHWRSLVVENIKLIHPEPVYPFFFVTPALPGGAAGLG